MDCSVSKEKFDKVFKELKVEQLSHLETKTKLLKTTEKLEVALAEIQQLNRQLKQEKQSFKEAFNHLKETAFEQKHQALILKGKYQEIERVCGNQETVIQLKESKIKELDSKLTDQKKSHQHQITDQEIHLQQERYLAQNYLNKTDSKQKPKKIF